MNGLGEVKVKVSRISRTFLYMVIVSCVLMASGAIAQDGQSYADLIAQWKSVEDINNWIGKNFSYDMDKALRVSRADALENRSAQILAPEEFISAKKGICVDLARFGHETLSKVAPELNPRYLMIEFVPIKKDGSVLRLHWIVLFEKGGKFYTFADSNRPGVIAGPHDSIESLVAAYQVFRGREVVSHKVLDSYKKKQKKKMSRQAK